MPGQVGTVNAANNQSQKAERQKLIAQVHIARKQLNMDEDTYRQALQGITGSASCSLMNVPQLRKVLDSFKARGFKNRPRGRTHSPHSRHIPPDLKTQQDKLRALWIDAHKDGLIQDGSETALCRWAGRMTRKNNEGVPVESIEWLNGRELSSVIESLKRWIKRLSTEPEKP
jgi:phage gp16-like protein